MDDVFQVKDYPTFRQQPGSVLLLLLELWCWLLWSKVMGHGGREALSLLCCFCVGMCMQNMYMHSAVVVAV
jgi:hypothetical protein